METEAILSRQLAVHFRRHLLAEQEKRSDLIDPVRFDHRSPRQINGELLAMLSDAFPGIETEPLPEENFFVEWVKRNQFVYRYEDFSFEAYNIIFFERLLTVRDWSEESNRRFHARTLAVFEKFNYRQDGFSVSFFIRVENNMRELLREMAMKMEGIDPQYAWQIIFEQSKQYQEVVNEFFERILVEERERSDRLLRNILPDQIAEELKKNDRVRPALIPEATVLFTDFKGFTQISERMEPDELVAELDECFSVFDSLVDRYGVEKIKTIGDSYMCAAGVPKPTATHMVDAALVALGMREAIRKLKSSREAENRPYWDVRIGLHSGPLVAGVIGRKKFSYDIWGDTVNTASRMESSGEPGRINVSADVAERLAHVFQFTPRGPVAAKNKGTLDMYFLDGFQPGYSDDGIHPGKGFDSYYEELRRSG